MERGFYKSVLACICTGALCTAAVGATVVPDGATRAVVLTVSDMNGELTPDAWVLVRTIDGEMNWAESVDQNYYMKDVGDKVLVTVTHPQYGTVTIEAALPMIDPAFANIVFTGQDRAYFEMPEPVLSDQAAEPTGGGEGGGSTCATCTPISEGVFAGSSCDGGSEADITSCTFSDTVTEWYCYTASCDGTATASTCGSGYDTALSAWDACGGSQLACNDDACGLQSTIAWPVSAGVTYYIRVSGFAGDCGGYVLEVSCEVPCQSDDDCPDGQACIEGNCVVPPCDLECPAGALEEGETCGTDNNGGCNSSPPAFTDAECGDTFCGNAWADGSTRDTDWYSVNHGGGLISATLTSQFTGVCFILDGVGPGGIPCNAAVVGNIGCSDDCDPIADASANLPAGHYVVFVAPGDCSGDGIFDVLPCGTANDYVLTINCEAPVVGACCLEDGTCVDGVSQEECESEPSAGCGDCDVPDPNGLPGCSDPACEAIVCGMDPFCCDIAWDSICADEAQQFCDCGGGGLGGEYQGDDTVCLGPLCVPVGGCCQCDEDEQFCTTETAEDCAALGGEYLGDFASCEAGGEQVTVSSNPNIPIPANDATGASDTIAMGMSFNILDLDVGVVINHTWVGDLCIVLSHGPDSIELMRRPGLAPDTCGPGSCCGCSDDNMDVIFDDDAASSIEDNCVLFGTFSPSPGSLSTFNNTDSAGDWTLTVLDGASADSGTLISWSLIFTPPASGDTPCGDALPDQCVAPQTLIIKQGACPVPFNTNSNGVTLMVLAGAEDFDVNDIDQSSLSLSRCDGVGGSVGPSSDPGGPPGVTILDLNHPNPDPATCATGGCTCNEDQSSDGADDLKMHFNSAEMTEVLELGSEPAGSIITLVLSGSLNSGGAFSAADCIRLVPPGSPPGVLLVGSNLPGVWVDVTPMDDALDEGGWTSFNRAYPQITEVTVTAPVVPYDHPNWILINIWIDGVSYPAQGVGAAQLTIDGNSNSVLLQYRQTQFNNPGVTPGVGGNSQQH